MTHTGNMKTKPGWVGIGSKFLTRNEESNTYRYEVLQLNDQGAVLFEPVGPTYREVSQEVAEKEPDKCVCTYLDQFDPERMRQIWLLPVS